LPANADSIVNAVKVLEDGGLIGLPTETVYGLAARADSGEAVARIFEVKARPAINPLIAHVASIEHALDLVSLDALGRALAKRFWPGPLSLVAPKRTDAPIHDLVTAGLETLAVRVPDHSVALDVLRRLGRPVAAPSANLSGRLSPTRAEDVAADLGADLDLILDGGAASAGLESTVIALLPGEPARLLRPGAIARAEIEAEIGPLAAPSDQTVTSPGQLLRHYATRKPLRLNVQAPGPDEAFLAFGAQAGAVPGPSLNLSKTGDLREAAANLFAHLRALDTSERPRIAVAPIPEDGLGEAINDRLRRSAAS
jgi:L-threonylcarbamoyladenylate synthase